MLEVHAILQRQRCNENITKKTGTLSDAYKLTPTAPFDIPLPYPTYPPIIPMLHSLLTSLKGKKTFANKSFTERITTSNNRTFFITMYFDL